MANMEEIHMPFGPDQADPCPNGEESSSPSEEEVVQFGHGFRKQKSRKYLRSILGKYCTACGVVTTSYI